MISPMTAVLRRHHLTSTAAPFPARLLGPPPSCPPRSVWDEAGDPWPLTPDQVVVILDRSGRPCESSRVRCVKPGELIEAEVGGVTVRGRLQ